MKKILGISLALWLTTAAAFQDPVPVRKAVEDFLRIQTRGLPGKPSFTVGSLGPGNQLSPCTSGFEVSQPPGAHAWGRSHVMVRCYDEGGWKVNIPVHIRVVADYLVTARPLSQGQRVGEADIARQTGDLSELPAGILTEPGQAVGRTAAQSLPAGRPLRADMLRQPLVVIQGQSVKLVSGGPGFRVSSEGRALNNGIEGQGVQVRLGNGQVVSGTARQGGIVEVAY